MMKAALLHEALGQANYLMKAELPHITKTKSTIVPIDVQQSFKVVYFGGHNNVG